ncbi:MAG: hypothetical protein VX899_24495 [Myxococcota bacterium]|nr:hypothetical protein [Myxococcota bacterium]
MRKESFNKGVLAAARVACAIALVGSATACRSTDKVPTDSMASVIDDTQGQDSGDTGATDTGPTDTGPTDALAECREQVAEVFAEAAPAPSQDDLDCCQDIAEYYDSVDLAGLEEWQERNGCCEALDWQGSLACTPWGPPCPPKMRGAA